MSSDSVGTKQPTEPPAGATPQLASPTPKHPAAAAPQKPAGGATAQQPASSAAPSPAAAATPQPAAAATPHGTYLPRRTKSPPPKEKVLRSGYRNYGYGNVIRSRIPSPEKKVEKNYIDAEDWRRSGDESYAKGDFIEALSFYEKAIAVSPANPAYRFDRSSALMGLQRLVDAAEACKEVLRIDPEHVQAHHRLGSLLLRLGEVYDTREHLCFPGGSRPNPDDLKKLQDLEKYMANLANYRRNNFDAVFQEMNKNPDFGINYSPRFLACIAEAHLNANRLNNAMSVISLLDQDATTTFSDSKIFGMISDSYILMVRSMAELAIGNFDGAVAAIDKAAVKDPHSEEIAEMAKKVKAVSRARNFGKELFKNQKFSEASSAYTEGIGIFSCNPVLYCNRAACWYKLGLFQQSVDDCDKALSSLPQYAKALLRRAAAYLKLERWKQAISEYELLRREHPDNAEIAESLFDAQVGLKKSLGEDVSLMKWGGSVESVDSLDKFRAVIRSQSASVVLFGTSSDPVCRVFSPSFDAICAIYPTMNFYNVDTEEAPEVAEAEKVKDLPTVNIYERGRRVSEMLRPTADFLDDSLEQLTPIL